MYDVPFLAPGNYTITFSKEGFRNLVREGIVLQIETLEMSAALQIGTSTQEIVVNATAPLIETETSDQHVDFTTTMVEAAPIVGTDWRAEMMQLIPGVNNGGGTGGAGGQAIGVNGTQAYNVNFLIDGSAATDPRDFNGSNYYCPWTPSRGKYQFKQCSRAVWQWPHFHQRDHEERDEPMPRQRV